MSDKKAIERFFLDKVAATYPDFPSGVVTDTERPDFLVLGQSLTTGIEVVRYIRGQGKGHKGSANRRSEILEQQLAEEARRLFEHSHSDPLMVHFLWHSSRNMRKADIPDLAATASTIVGRYVPQTLFGSTRIANNALVGTPLQPLVSSIHVTRVRNQRQASWSSIGAGFISVPTSELQELVASKNAKVPDYLQRCDEVWLLIVADGRYISSTVDLPEDVQQVYFQSKFHRILFFDLVDGQVTTLARTG